MATMEKPRRTKPAQKHVEDSDDIPSEDAMDRTLSELMEEPVEYTFVDAAPPTTLPPALTTCSLPSEVIQSLRSVKQVCLVSLDSLLHQIVDGLPSSDNSRDVRRLSDSQLQQSCHRGILGSITNHANRLSHANSSSQPTSSFWRIKRSESSPALAAMCDVQRMLDAQQGWLESVGSDYNLCCALAALLHDVYRMLELSQSEDITTAHMTTTSTPLDPVSVYTQLREQVSTFQRERAAGRMAIESDASREMTILWNEVDHLMDAVNRLAHDRPSHVEGSPPAYQDLVDTPHVVDGKPPPEYNEKVHVPLASSSVPNEKAQHDLDSLLSAIDRLSTVTPRLNNQRVGLSERQANELAAATVGKAIERLSRGRMENQRASLPTTTKHDMLRDLVAQICQSASRTLDNQRAKVDKKKMDMAAFNGFLDKFDRGRLSNQDWIPREEILLKELTDMTDLIAKSLQRPRYGKQRHSLSPGKERDLFMNTLFRKVDQLEGRRMSNQDAHGPVTAVSRGHSVITQEANPDAEEELSRLFDHINKAKSQLDNQRASFSNSMNPKP